MAWSNHQQEDEPYDYHYYSGSQVCCNPISLVNGVCVYIYIYIYSIYHVITSLHLMHPIIVQLLVEPLIVLHLPVQLPGLFRWLRAPGSLGLRARSEARWPRLRGAFFRGWWRFVKGKIMEGPIFLGNLSLFSRVRERERESDLCIHFFFNILEEQFTFYMFVCFPARQILLPWPQVEHVQACSG